MVMIPHDSVGVKIRGRIKPEVHPLLSIPFSMSVDICLNCVRLTTTVPQELKIQLVTYSVGVRVHLQ